MHYTSRRKGKSALAGGHRARRRETAATSIQLGTSWNGLRNLVGDGLDPGKSLEHTPSARDRLDRAAGRLARPNGRPLWGLGAGNQVRTWGRA